MDQDHVARRLAEQYAATGNVCSVVLAGSLGRGRADRFSDVELDVYWEAPPTDAQRRAAAYGLGGTVTTLWPYDGDDSEWSEDVHVQGVDVTVSGFARAEIDHWIDALPDATGPSIVQQMRLSALHEGKVLYGEALVQRWRGSSSYPRTLAVATATSFLTPRRLNRWRLWRALVHRGDVVMLHRACSDAAEVIFGVLCAVNRIYIEHPMFKWSRHLAGRFGRAPSRFTDRLLDGLDAGTAESAARLHTLLVETIEIVESDLPEVDTTVATDLVSGRR